MAGSFIKSKHHTLARDFLIPILVGIVGLVGSLGGVYIANSHNTKQATTQKAIEFESKILEQRISLLDRTAKIFGKSPGLQDYWEKYIKIEIPNKTQESNISSSDLIDRLTDAQGEFQSVVMLASVYFGPKTNQALSELSDVKGPWWTKPKEKQDALLTAMSQELSFGFQSLPILKINGQ